jgi:hypothetical protein
VEEREIVEAKQRDLRTTDYKAVIRFFCWWTSLGSACKNIFSEADLEQWKL